MPQIRVAVLEDAKSLAELARQTFIDAFAAQNNEDNIRQHCENSYSESIQAKEIVDPGYKTIVIDDETRLIGFAQIRWGQTKKGVSATFPCEIQRLYVDKQWYGSGIAQQLMNACLALIKQRGGDCVWLGVWEHNPRAIAYYKKFGFQPVSEHQFNLGAEPQRDIIMMLPLK